MINNFDLFEKLLTFEEPGEYYHVYILRRGKDHGDHRDSLIKSYYVKNVDYYRAKQDEIIKLCDLFGARCYGIPSVKNFRRTAFEVLKIASDKIYREDYSNLDKIFASATDSIGSKRPLWILDYDYSDTVTDETIAADAEFINTIEPLGENKIKAVIPTKHGKHVITKPFNIQAFGEHNTKDLIHKNNPTLLYIPDIK